MKLVTFQGASRGDRIGALAAEGWIIDLNAACASYLRNVEQEGAFYALADARVPSNMRGLFENGDRGLDAAQTALEYATRGGPETKGVSGEPIFFRRELIAEFLALPPDSQAKSVVNSHADQARFVDVDDAGIRDDVDDPAAYRRLLETA